MTQRQAEKRAALALVTQRRTELDAAHRRVARSEELAPKGATPQQVLDDDRARHEGTKAAVAAAEAQVAAADAAIGTAESQVVGAQAAAEAALATIDRIQADIDDSALKAPRDGRVQYRVAQAGEVQLEVVDTISRELAPLIERYSRDDTLEFQMSTHLVVAACSLSVAT